MARAKVKKLANKSKRTANLGALYDATNWREIAKRPIEQPTVGPIINEVNLDDRIRLLSDSRKLYANVGVIKGATDGKSTYAVGRSWLPKFEGADTEWGNEARKWLLNEWYPIADIRGYDFQTMLFLASVSVDRDGDLGAMLVEYETGFPAVQLVPAHAVGSRSLRGEDVVRSGAYRGLREVDGVVLNDWGRPVAFHVLGEKESGDQYVSARDMQWMMEPQWLDQVRGLPGFSHAILDIKDLRTVQGYEKAACALASSIGLLEYNETGTADLSDPSVGLSGAPGMLSETVIEERQGGTVKYFKSNSGAKLEAFKSERPGDQWDRFMNRLIRGAMAGINWPYELAWDIAALGGANTRFIISSAMRSVEDRQDLLRPFARRAVGYAIRKAIKLGKLPENESDWWRWSFTMPPRMTADFGRDSAAQREDYLNGIINLGDICGERGADLDQHIAARKAENDKLAAAGLPVPGVFGEMQAKATEQTPTGGDQTIQQN